MSLILRDLNTDEVIIVALTTESLMYIYIEFG